ncbi:MAG: hypothetical protein ACLS9K_05060 [Lachnospira eligens]
MVVIKNKSRSSDSGDISIVLLMVTLVASLTVFMTYYIFGVESNVNKQRDYMGNNKFDNISIFRYIDFVG